MLKVSTGQEAQRVSSAITQPPMGAQGVRASESPSGERCRSPVFVLALQTLLRQASASQEVKPTVQGGWEDLYYTLQSLVEG